MPKICQQKGVSFAGFNQELWFKITSWSCRYAVGEQGKLYMDHDSTKINIPDSVYWDISRQNVEQRLFSNSLTYDFY